MVFFEGRMAIVASRKGDCVDLLGMETKQHRKLSILRAAPINSAYRTDRHHTRRDLLLLTVAVRVVSNLANWLASTGRKHFSPSQSLLL